MNASPSMRWWTPMTVAVGLALAAVLVVVAAIAAAGSGDATPAVPEIESPGADDDPDGTAPSDDEPVGPADSDEPTGDSSDAGAAPELDTGADERRPLVIHHVGDVNLDAGVDVANSRTTTPVTTASPASPTASATSRAPG